MWLSGEMRRPRSRSGAELGVTSIAGEGAGVLAGGELRELPVYGPGGYVWLPESGGTVLVVRGGPGGEERCVAGQRQSAAPAGMQPGEVCIHAGGASVLLKNDGTILLRGAVSVEGSLTVNGQSCNAGQTLPAQE